MIKPSRRALLAAGLALPQALAAAPAPAAPAADVETLARDEAYWRRVGDLWDRPTGAIQLENGQFGAMVRPVLLAYEAATVMVNRETTLYTRGPVMNPQLQAVREQTAAFLGVGADEIAFSRGASESMAALIGGYNRLRPGDAVLYADLDYDSMQTCMQNLAHLRGVRVVKFDLPEPATRQNLIDAYERAFKANPEVKLVLLTHLSHRTGLVPPIREIADMARARGIDCILDGGHALGQIDFDLSQLGVDFAGLNMHKWMGAPLGVGLVYIRRGRAPDIDRHVLEPASDRIDARIHTGTSNYPALLAVPEALKAHAAIGIGPKAARLRYLRGLWAEAVRDNPAVEVMTPEDAALHGGITSFRLKGKGSPDEVIALKTALRQRYRISVVERLGVAKGGVIRVSPGFVNDAEEMRTLAKAINALSRA
jgi:selenocysteine lyase/cysteine desulfurase